MCLMINYKGDLISENEIIFHIQVSILTAIIQGITSVFSLQRIIFPSECFDVDLELMFSSWDLSKEVLHSRTESVV